jgi:UDP-glucose 4-epimerase
MHINDDLILITGVNGFIGNHLFKNLVNNGNHVIGISRNRNDTLIYPPNFKILDLSNRIEINKFIMKHKPNYVIHLASANTKNYTASSYIESYQANLLCSLNLIEACENNVNLKKFIYIGTSDEYGFIQSDYIEGVREKPTSSYGLSKLSITNVLQALAITSNFPSLILRPTIIYGPGQKSSMLIPSVIDALSNGKEFNMSNGEQFRDFVYIDDMIDAIILAIQSKTGVNGQIINISYGKSFKLKYVINLITSIIGKQSHKLINFGNREYRAGEIMNYVVSNKVAEKILGWFPKTNLDSGLVNTIKSIQ